MNSAGSVTFNPARCDRSGREVDMAGSTASSGEADASALGAAPPAPPTPAPPTPAPMVHAPRSRLAAAPAAASAGASSASSTMARALAMEMQCSSPGPARFELMSAVRTAIFAMPAQKAM